MMEIYSFGQGEPIIFLHGMVGDHNAFRKEMADLSSEYEVITYDLLGHGEDRGVELTFTLETLQQQLDYVYMKCGIEQAHLCSLSFGSYIVNAYAQHYPNKVLSITNVGGYFNNSSPLFDIFKYIWDTQDLPYEDWIDLIANQINSTNPYAKESIEIFSKYARRVHSTILKQTFQICLQTDMKSILRGIKQPVLWIMGEDDNLFKSSIYDLQKLIPHVIYKEIPKAGHVVQVNQSRSFIDIFRKFIKHRQLWNSFV